MYDICFIIAFPELLIPQTFSETSSTLFTALLYFRHCWNGQGDPHASGKLPSIITPCCLSVTSHKEKQYTFDGIFINMNQS